MSNPTSHDDSDSDGWGKQSRVRGDRQVLMSPAVWHYQVRMEMRPQSIFAKVMSLFHKNILQADRFLCSVIDFLFHATKWTLSNGKAASPTWSLQPFSSCLKRKAWFPLMWLQFIIRKAVSYWQGFCTNDIFHRLTLSFSAEHSKYTDCRVNNVDSRSHKQTEPCDKGDESWQSIGSGHF